MELKCFVLDFRFLSGGLRFVCYGINAMRIQPHHQFIFSLQVRNFAVVIIFRIVLMP
jgi:hypothetical protein